MSTKSFVADLEAFGDMTERMMDHVFRGAAQDTSEQMTRARDGVVRGAPFQEGVVPVDQGQLINSVVVRVDGAANGQGAGGMAPDYAAALGALTSEEAAEVVFTAPYARRIEYGFSGDDSLGRTYNQPGRFMVRNAVQNWDETVEANARYERSRS